MMDARHNWLHTSDAEHQTVLPRPLPPRPRNTPLDVVIVNDLLASNRHDGPCAMYAIADTAVTHQDYL